MRCGSGGNGAGRVRGRRVGGRVEDEERGHVGDVPAPEARRKEIRPRRLGIVREAGIAGGHVPEVIGQHGTSPEYRGEEGRDEERGGWVGGETAHDGSGAGSYAIRAPGRGRVTVPDHECNPGG